MSEPPGPDDVSTGTAGTDRGMLDSVTWGLRPERARARLRWLLTGERREPRPGWIGLYEPPVAERDDVGVCCSGGGIRSAAFNLGALQTLQSERHGVLQRSKYLAAVSGGSYIAAAFCMVAKTWNAALYTPGKRPPASAPGGDDSDPGLVDDDAPPFGPGSPEEQYLRNHLGYLAPNGLARVYLALRMLAGLLVNVVLIGTPVLLAGLAVGGAMRGRIHAAASGGHHFDVPPGVWWPVAGLGAITLALAVLDVTWRPRRDVCRAALETWQLRCFLFSVAGGAVLVALPWLATRALDAGHVSVDEAALRSAGAAVSSVGALFLAAVGHVRGRLKDERKAIDAATRRLGRFLPKLREAAIAAVVLLVGPLLLLAIAMVGTLIAVGTDVIWAWLAGSAGMVALLWLVADLNSISLHPFYRRRLATAFALKRVWVDGDGREHAAPPPGPERAAGRVVARERDFDRIVELSQSGVEPGCCAIKSWPMLIVCAAANVSDPGATPPGRAVASFTFSPTAIGGPLTAAAPTAYYEHDLGRNRRRDVTLPAAVAMSGAALSPSMGKLTYRPLTFLLGLANIRLGVWVPNPACVNERHIDAEDGGRPSALSPRSLRRGGDRPAATRASIVHRPRPNYLWKEVLGRNRLEDEFLYVTDGGHYENLGLVELLRRGCRTVYCFDAGGGTTSRALGDAIALARTELDVEIRMEPEAAALAEDPATHRAARCCARGRILYPEGEGGERVEGTLFYVRSVLSDDAPWALRSFQESDPVFPHHSTSDQFFDDQRFEAYRQLGMAAAERVLGLERLHGAPEPGLDAGADGAGRLPAAV